jgi:acyl-CoA synthetase (AMP-forming)/AMP-acid ligase II
MYGITECKRVSIMPPGQWATRPGSSGRPLPGVTVTVVDAECHPLPSGRVGEIVVTGPNVTSGYWRDPAATAACFRLASAAAGTLFTGDYGTIDADGYLYIAGRRDDQFKRRGVRTSAVEIESAAEDIAGVGLAALLLAPDPDDIHLVVVPDASGASLTADDVLRQLGARLEAAKVPRACTLLGDPPLTASGKIDKKAISDMLETA